MSRELLIGKHKLKVPVLLNGMSRGLTRAPIVSAVANEGGGGTIGGSGLAGKEFMDQTDLPFDEANRDALRIEIRKSRSLTKGILGVNILRAVRDFEGLARVAFEEEIDYFACGAGFDLDLPIMAKNFPNTALIPIISSDVMARKFIHHWGDFGRLPNAFMVEGPKAGGHLAFSENALSNPNRQLEVMVRKVKDFLRSQKETYDIPVIAAGGVWDHEDMERMMSEDVGADGVGLATRFVTTKECSAGDAFKEMYMEASKRGTVLINSPVGLLGRAIHNDFTERVSKKRKRNVPYNCKRVCLEQCKFREKGETFCIWNALEIARTGNKRQVERGGLVFSGENAGRATEITSVKQVLDSLLGKEPVR